LNKEKKDLILSSSSKNRENILSKIGVPFIVYKPNVSEFRLEKESPA
tara:strand:+ start:115 stop:255 length:141 start_codon:yes stop_codon:yes gene_type:complete